MDTCWKESFEDVDMSEAVTKLLLGGEQGQRCQCWGHSWSWILRKGCWGISGIHLRSVHTEQLAGLNEEGGKIHWR